MNFRLEQLSQRRRNEVKANQDFLVKYSNEMSKNKSQDLIDKAKSNIQDINAKEVGVDTDRLKYINSSIDETESWNNRYHNRISNLEIHDNFDMNISAWKSYESQVKKLNIFKSGNSLVSYMRSLDKSREKHSKRRKFDVEEDVTFINQRNYKFNQKLSRIYDKYTEELRGNIEGGL